MHDSMSSANRLRIEHEIRERDYTNALNFMLKNTSPFGSFQTDIPDFDKDGGLHVLGIHEDNHSLTLITKRPGQDVRILSASGDGSVSEQFSREEEGVTISYFAPADTDTRRFVKDVIRAGNAYISAEKANPNKTENKRRFGFIGRIIVGR